MYFIYIFKCKQTERTCHPSTHTFHIPIKSSRNRNKKMFVMLFVSPRRTYLTRERERAHGSQSNNNFRQWLIFLPIFHQFRWLINYYNFSFCVCARAAPHFSYTAATYCSFELFSCNFFSGHPTNFSTTFFRHRGLEKFMAKCERRWMFARNRK